MAFFHFSQSLILGAVVVFQPAVAAAAESVVDEGAATKGPQPVTCAPVQEKQKRLPAYIEDWGRLAELTQSDPVVFLRADQWATRRRAAVTIGSGGLVAGGGIGLLATVVRLTSNSWTTTTKWGLAGGVGTAAFSLLLAWAISPDRSDRLDVINQWNLRHPDLPLAP